MDQAFVIASKAQQLDPTFETGYVWNSLCWSGSVYGQPSEVLSACNKAVLLEPGNGGFRDSRGLARALTGNTVGAIDDFQAFVKWNSDADRKAQRQRWIDALRSGKPASTIFTKEVLEQLRNQ